MVEQFMWCRVALALKGDSVDDLGNFNQVLTSALSNPGPHNNQVADNFGIVFMRLARSVYRLSNEGVAIEPPIGIQFSSVFLEKSYGSHWKFERRLHGIK